jgi:signal transduction histidine kinase
MNGLQALTVLYDLALTIGSEVAVEPLLCRTLQRLLYHTGFPAGLALSEPTATESPEWREVKLAAVVGNYALVKRQGERLRLPAGLLADSPALGEDQARLAGFEARRPYRHYLRLPVPGFGTLLLLSPDAPSGALPLTDLFTPILERLATSLLLCRRVEERTRALEEANRELEAFAYSVSHDLRAPLRVIDGFSLILLEDYADRLDDEGRRLLNIVRANTCRMDDLIGDILSFSRMSRHEMASAEVDMAGLVREVFAELRQAAPNRVLRLDLADLPPAHGDRALLRQVWTNLLANAIKFTQPRAEAVIRVGGEATPAETIYRVEDNGVGFDMQYAGKLFGVFQRLHASEDFEGTGIGLAIVKRIVARHGGRVWAEGRPGEGATFCFSLPAGAPPPLTFSA